jgi:hypothetical protein
MYLTRKRAELLVHIKPTNSQSTCPRAGKKLASKAKRAGVAERFPKPAVQKSLDVALALIGSYDHLRNDVELPIIRVARQHDAQPLYLFQTVPGIG